MFEASERIELAETNFKALTLLAGATNANREKYEVQLKLFCGKYALDCQNGNWIEQATADLMIRADVTSKLVDFRRVATENPAQIYKELMLHMVAVDDSILSRFDPVLDLTEVDGAYAKGAAKQVNGRVSQFNFVKTSAGWMLRVAR